VIRGSINLLMLVVVDFYTIEMRISINNYQLI